MEAETRLTSGAAACSHAGTGPHGGNAEMLLPRWSGKSLQRETRAANAKESQELEADQRPGLGKGLPQVAGAGRASTSQRHHRAHLKRTVTLSHPVFPELLANVLQSCCIH